MKPKYSRFRKLALPALIVLPSIAPLTYAAIIVPGITGDFTVLSGPAAADTVDAIGGTSATPSITIQEGATLTGDAVLQYAVIVSAPGYTIDNSGTLSVAAEAAIFVDAAASADITIINNEGALIEGGNDGVYLDGDGGTIFNSGIIRGNNGVNSDGIEGFSGLTVTNSGLISGNSSGIVADDDLQVFNERGAATSGGVNEGIFALNNAFIENFGSITSDQADAIVVLDDAVIFNSTNLDEDDEPEDGGFIEGAESGIFAGNNLQLVNEDMASIYGLNGYGVNAGDNAQITNEEGGLISGSLGGIIVGADAEIINDGIIEGEIGITTTDGSLVINSGIIRSTEEGGIAFSGGFGDDEVILTSGSLVEGDILGGGGTNTLTLDGGATSPQSPTNIIRGSVTDFETITKEGAGVALIGGVEDVETGLLVITDTIDINSGGLYFNADIQGLTGPLATINANGSAVGGTGVWDADVFVNSGGISAGAIPIDLDVTPENSVGLLEIRGDVVHQQGSFIRMDIIPDTVINPGVNSDLILQTGAGNTYDVSGGNLRISPTDVNRVITPGTYTIIDSEEAIVGLGDFGNIGIQFNDNILDTGPFRAAGSGPDYMDSVLINYFSAPGLEDDGTNLVIDFDYDFAGLPGLSQNQATIAAVLDALALQAGTGTLGEAEQDLIAALALSDLPAVQASLAALDPQSSVALAIGIVNSNYRLHRMVQDRMGMARNQPGTTTMTSPAPMRDAKGGLIYSPPTQQVHTNRGAVWGAFSWDRMDFDDRDSIRDSDGDIKAFTIGVDYRVDSRFVMGGLIDGSRSDFDFNGGSSDIDSLRFAAYGTFGQAMGFYSDFLVGYGTHDLDQNQTFGGVFATSDGFSNDADSFQAMLTAGFAMGTQQFKHGPYAGLEYQRISVDGFSPLGGVFGLTVDDYRISSLRGLIGYRMDGVVGGFLPYASIAYAHEFRDSPNNASATIGGTSFRVTGPELRSSVLVTAGAGFAFTENLMMDIGYRGDIRAESTGLSSHGATVGLTFNY
ncbi:MAG: autotransporter outer membrane beta-barrel domain-containing protein [Akkermansiaceae bacterium]